MLENQAAEPFFLLAGPNVIESEDHILHMAKNIKAITSKYYHYSLIFVYYDSIYVGNKTVLKFCYL